MYILITSVIHRLNGKQLLLLLLLLLLMSFIWRNFESMQQMRHVDCYRRCSLCHEKCFHAAVHGIQTATCPAII